MSRVKRGVTKHARHHKILRLAKGYQGRRKSNYSVARTAVFKAADDAFSGRKQRKRDFRSLWIQRINAAVRGLGMKYSRWIFSCKQAGVHLDRKMMSDLCVHRPDVFKNLFEKINQFNQLKSSSGTHQSKSDQNIST